MFEANSCGIFSAIHEQSPDINQGVERKKKEDQGAGDQGMMFGYANRETDTYMPLPLELAHMLLRELAAIRKEGKKMKYLRPDAKSQVTIEYNDDHTPKAISAIVISTQHDDFDGEKKMLSAIRKDVEEILIPRVMKQLPSRVQKLFKSKYTLHVNPTGKFVIGGPHGDTGLTGRKIIVDTYGGKGAHGGGAFSGKDPSKVDRSAAYATRHIAKNMVAAGICDEVLVQVAYAIGVAEPVGLYVNTYGTAKVKMSDGEIAGKINKVFDMRPYAIEQRFKLRTPIYRETAAYGHMGRKPELKEKTFRDGSGKTIKVKVKLFPWEELDYTDRIRKEFGLK
jgi:S-adenosylmethionine synthetase